jgi:hypothetical protein
VPFFVKEGEKVKVYTETREFAGRAGGCGKRLSSRHAAKRREFGARWRKVWKEHPTGAKGRIDLMAYRQDGSRALGRPS